MRWSLRFERKVDGSGWELSYSKEDGSDAFANLLHSAFQLFRELVMARPVPLRPVSRPVGPN